MAGRCGLEDYARRCVRCRVPKHADSSSAAELDARLSLPVPNEVTLRARAREERCARVMHQRFPVVQQLSVATDRRRSIYFEACANGNRVYKIRKSTETRSQKKIVYGTRYQDFFFSLGRLGFLKSAFLRKNFRETTNRRVTFRALSTTPTSSHHADFRQDSCVHPPSFHREPRVTSASPPPRRGHRPRLGRPFRDGS